MKARRDRNMMEGVHQKSNRTFTVLWRNDGWYWWTSQDENAGPFETSKQAYDDAMKSEAKS